MNKTISVFGLTESAVLDHLVEIRRQFATLEFEIQTEFPIIKVEISKAESMSDLLKVSLDDAGQRVCRKLGAYAFSETGQNMEQVVGLLLQQNSATLAVAESCTGGLIANLLTDVPGSSDYFLLSAVTYSNSAKMDILRVNAQTLARHGAVSEQTAVEMASGAKKTVGATFGLATSGIAGPGGGTHDKPIGTVCLGLATPSAVHGQRLFFPGLDRKLTKRIFAVAALNCLRIELLANGTYTELPGH